MEKTELMIEYEIKIDSVVNWEANPIGYAKYLESELIKERAKPTITYQAVETFQEIIRNQCDEITALKEKAEAYDRLMSGGKKTPKDVANFLDLPIAQDKEGFWHAFGSPPVIDEVRGTWGSFLGYEKEIPSCNIRYAGDWESSLTLPDGWEEA